MVENGKEVDAVQEPVIRLREKDEQEFMAVIFCVISRRMKRKCYEVRLGVVGERGLRLGIMNWILNGEEGSWTSEWLRTVGGQTKSRWLNQFFCQLERLGVVEPLFKNSKTFFRKRKVESFIVFERFGSHIRRVQDKHGTCQAIKSLKEDELFISKLCYI